MTTALRNLRGERAEIGLIGPWRDDVAAMWIGLTYVGVGEAEDAMAEPLALVSLFRPDGTRLLRVRAGLPALPELLRTLRACSEGAPRGQPPCPRCGGSLGVPDIDTSLEAAA